MTGPRLARGTQERPRDARSGPAPVRSEILRQTPGAESLNWRELDLLQEIFKPRHLDVPFTLQGRDIEPESTVVESAVHAEHVLTHILQGIFVRHLDESAGHTEAPGEDLHHFWVGLLVARQVDSAPNPPVGMLER